MYVVRCPFCRDEITLPFVRLGAARRCAACNKTSRIQIEHIVSQPEGSRLKTPKAAAIPQVPEPATDNNSAQTATAAPPRSSGRRKGILGFLGLVVGLAALLTGIMFVSVSPDNEVITINAWNSSVQPSIDAHPDWQGSTLATAHQSDIVLELPAEAAARLTTLDRPAYAIIRAESQSVDHDIWEAELPPVKGKPVRIILDAEPGTPCTITLFTMVESH